MPEPNASNLSGRTHALKKKTSLKDHVCGFCRTEFTASRSLLRHERESCKYRIDKRQKYHCSICHESFFRLDDRIRHIEEQHGDGKPPCTRCEKRVRPNAPHRSPDGLVCKEPTPRFHPYPTTLSEEAVPSLSPDDEMLSHTWKSFPLDTEIEPTLGDSAFKSVDTYVTKSNLFEDARPESLASTPDSTSIDTPPERLYEGSVRDSTSTRALDRQRDPVEQHHDAENRSGVWQRGLQSQSLQREPWTMYYRASFPMDASVSSNGLDTLRQVVSSRSQTLVPSWEPLSRTIEYHKPAAIPLANGPAVEVRRASTPFLLCGDGALPKLFKCCTNHVSSCAQFRKHYQDTHVVGSPDTFSLMDLCPTEALAEIISKGASLDVVIFLLSQGLMYSRKAAWRAMNAAISQKDTPILGRLLDHGVDVNFQPAGSRYPSALHHASEVRFAEGSRLLVQHGASLDTQDCMGKTALHRVCDMNDVEIARILLEAGATVDLIAPVARLTPLRIAVMNNDMAMIHLLIDSGAKLSNRTRDDGVRLGSYILHKAVANNCADVVQLLLAKGEGGAVYRHTHPLFCEVTSPKVAQLLLDYGQSIDEPSKTNNQTALMRATTNGRVDLVQWLCDHGADVSVTDREHHTALCYARGYIHPESLKHARHLNPWAKGEILSILVQRGAKTCDVCLCSLDREES